MHEYQATITWKRDDNGSAPHRYGREHTWTFDGGLTVPASASPHLVRAPIDPEEAFVAALSSCHMLWFLDLAARRGYRVTNYVDRAVGVMEKSKAGKVAITRVRLRPEATFAGEKLPTTDEIDALHHAAHEECFIANSVTTDVSCEPIYTE